MGGSLEGSLNNDEKAQVHKTSGTFLIWWQLPTYLPSYFVLCIVNLITQKYYPFFKNDVLT